MDKKIIAGLAIGVVVGAGAITTNSQVSKIKETTVIEKVGETTVTVAEPIAPQRIKVVEVSKLKEGVIRAGEEVIYAQRELVRAQDELVEAQKLYDQAIAKGAVE